MSGGGSSGGTQVVQTDSTPFEEKLPFVVGSFRMAEQAARQAQRQPIPQGTFGAMPGTAELLAAQLVQQTGANNFNLGGGTLALTNDLTGRLGAGEYSAEGIPQVNAEQMARLAPVLEAATRPITQQVTEQILPQLSGDATASGAYSGERANAILPGIIARDYNQAIADAAAGLAFQDTQSLREAQPRQQLLEAQMLSMIPQLQQAGVALDLLGPQTVLQGGELLRGLQGIPGEQARNEYLFQTQAPFAGLNEFASILAGAEGQSGTQTTTQQNPSGGLGGAIQGGLGGGLAGFQMGGPVGGAIGAILGGLGGGIS